MYTLMKLQGYGTVILPCLLLQEQSTSALGACFYVTALDHLIGRSNHRSLGILWSTSQRKTTLPLECFDLEEFHP